MLIKYCLDEIVDICEEKIKLIYRIGLLDIDKQNNNDEIINEFFDEDKFLNFLFILTSDVKPPEIKEEYRDYIVTYSTKGLLIKDDNNFLVELLKQRKYTDITKEILRKEKLKRING